MKKLVLIIGIILCIAVIGSVFAVAVYDAQDATGSIGADEYVYLTLNSSGTTGCNLVKGVPTIIPIVMGIESTAESWGTAKLTVSATANEGKSIDNVEITLWEDLTCTQAIEGLTVEGITESGTVYVKLQLVGEDLSEEDVNNAGGVLNIKLVQVA